MTFRKTVLAYLTGWLIAQPLYNRLLAAWRRRELANPSRESRAYWEHQAEAIVDAAERRAERQRALGGHRPTTVLLIDPRHDLVPPGEMAAADYVFALDPVLGVVCLKDRLGAPEKPSLELRTFGLAAAAVGE